MDHATAETRFAGTPPAEEFGGWPVKFGPGKDDKIPHSWAEKMLTELAQERPAQFKKLLAEAALNGR